MKNNRRDFIKLASMAGIGLTGASIIPAFGQSTNKSKPDQVGNQAAQNHIQKFNMSGYGAPKLDTVRVGFIGTGNRGTGAVVRMSKIGGVEIKA
jgi:hypothetical protein